MSDLIGTYVNLANIVDKNPNALALGVRQYGQDEQYHAWAIPCGVSLCIIPKIALGNLVKFLKFLVAYTLDIC